MTLLPLLAILVAVLIKFSSAANAPLKSYEINTHMGDARTESFVTYARAVGNCALANPTTTGTLSDAWLQGQGCLPAGWIRPGGADWTNLISPPPAGGSTTLAVWGTTPTGLAAGLGEYLARENAVSNEAGYAPPALGPTNPADPPGAWFTSQALGINQAGSWWSPASGYICTDCVPSYVPTGALLSMFSYSTPAE